MIGITGESASHTDEQLESALAKIAAAAKENGIRYDISKPETRAADPDHVAKERMRTLQTASMEGRAETEWRPEPLSAAPPPGAGDPTTTYKLAVSAAGLKPADPSLELRTTDFLQLSKAREPLDAAEAALRHYGCGTCGPRGFYGTLDVHLELEAALATFLGTEQVRSSVRVGARARARVWVFPLPTFSLRHRAGDRLLLRHRHDLALTLTLT